ncbi:MAG: DUF5685 family protein [Clostridiales bacterium]|nr:DUF5685 family protein [Clostridiales bacterium]
MPEKPELKIKEFELFRAYYCSVCKSIGKRYGQVPRLTLNYDSAFLALLISSINDKELRVCRERCVAHPAKKKNVIINDEIIDYASDMNVLLAYYNLMDKRNDGDSKLSAAAVMVLKPAYKKLKKKYKEKCDIIESKLEQLSLLEKEGCCSMDEAAEPFAGIMEIILAFEPLCRDSKNERILKWMGYNLGKWIYILDAYDDVEKDIRKKTYNSLVRQFCYKDENVDDFKNRIKDKVEFVLTYTLSEVGKAYELLDIKKNAGIVENIIFMGMLRKTEQILKIGVVKN